MDDPPKIQAQTPSWLVKVILLGGAWIAGLTGVTAYVLIQEEERGDKVAQQAENNRLNAVRSEAMNCIAMHERTMQTRAAVNITPDAIVEVSAGSPDSDPVQLQAFLDSIERRVNEALQFPDCNLEEARRNFEEARQDLAELRAE